MSRLNARSDWKLELAIIRSVLSGAMAATSACLWKHAGMSGAVVIAILAATYAGTLQLLNKDFLNWLANRAWFSASAPASRAERAPLVTGLLKRATASSFYAVMMSSGYYAAGLNQDLMSVSAVGRMLTMVALSLYVQSAWQALNQEATQGAVRRRPSNEYLYRRVSGVASLVHAMTIVLGSALNVGGSPLGPVLSGVVGTTGLIAYFGYRAVSSSTRRTSFAFRGGSAVSA